MAVHQRTGTTVLPTIPDTIKARHCYARPVKVPSSWLRGATIVAQRPRIKDKGITTVKQFYDEYPGRSGERMLREWLRIPKGSRFQTSYGYAVAMEMEEPQCATPWKEEENPTLDELNLRWPKGWKMFDGVTRFDFAGLLGADIDPDEPMFFYLFKYNTPLCEMMSYVDSIQDESGDTRIMSDADILSHLCHPDDPFDVFNNPDRLTLTSVRRQRKVKVANGVQYWSTTQVAERFLDRFQKLASDPGLKQKLMHLVEIARCAKLTRDYVSNFLAFDEHDKQRIFSLEALSCVSFCSIDPLGFVNDEAPNSSMEGAKLQVKYLEELKAKHRGCTARVSKLGMEDYLKEALARSEPQSVPIESDCPHDVVLNSTPEPLPKRPRADPRPNESAPEPRSKKKPRNVDISFERVTRSTKVDASKDVAEPMSTDVPSSKPVDERQQLQDILSNATECAFSSTTGRLVGPLKAIQLFGDSLFCVGGYDVFNVGDTLHILDNLEHKIPGASKLLAQQHSSLVKEGAPSRRDWLLTGDKNHNGNGQFVLDSLNAPSEYKGGSAERTAKMRSLNKGGEFHEVCKALRHFGDAAPLEYNGNETIPTTSQLLTKVTRACNLSLNRTEPNEAFGSTFFKPFKTSTADDVLGNGEMSLQDQWSIQVQKLTHASDGDTLTHDRDPRNMPMYGVGARGAGEAFGTTVLSGQAWVVVSLWPDYMNPSKPEHFKFRVVPGNIWGLRGWQRFASLHHTFPVGDTEVRWSMTLRCKEAPMLAAVFYAEFFGFPYTAWNSTQHAALKTEIGDDFMEDTHGYLRKLSKNLKLLEKLKILKVGHRAKPVDSLTIYNAMIPHGLILIDGMHPDIQLEGNKCCSYKYPIMLWHFNALLTLGSDDTGDPFRCLRQGLAIRWVAKATEGGKLLISFLKASPPPPPPTSFAAPPSPPQRSLLPACSPSSSPSQRPSLPACSPSSSPSHSSVSLSDSQSPSSVLRSLSQSPTTLSLDPDPDSAAHSHSPVATPAPAPVTRPAQTNPLPVPTHRFTPAPDRDITREWSNTNENSSCYVDAALDVMLDMCRHMQVKGKTLNPPMYDEARRLFYEWSALRETINIQHEFQSPLNFEQLKEKQRELRNLVAKIRYENYKSEIFDPVELQKYNLQNHPQMRSFGDATSLLKMMLAEKGRGNEALFVQTVPYTYYCERESCPRHVINSNMCLVNNLIYESVIEAVKVDIANGVRQKGIRNNKTYCPLSVWANAIHIDYKAPLFCCEGKDAVNVDEETPPEVLQVVNACAAPLHRKTVIDPDSESGPIFIMLRMPDKYLMQKADEDPVEKERPMQPKLSSNPHYVRFGKNDYKYELFTAIIHNGCHYNTLVRRGNKWIYFEGFNTNGKAIDADGPHRPSYRPVLACYRRCDD